jgi:hypothetical protein
MTGHELISKVVLSLNSYLGFNNEDVKDLITIDENIDEALEWLKLLSPPPIFVNFIDSLINLTDVNLNNFITTPYNFVGTVNIIDFSQPNFEKKNRSFAYSNLEFGFASSRALFNNNDLIDLSDIKFSLIWKQIEEYLERCYSINDDTGVNNLFDIIKNIDLNKGLVINKTATTFEDERHYSYIYLCFLNESNSIFLPAELEYTTSLLTNTLTFDGGKNYEQFFDIYDVINELNQSPDILNRFLRLYHTLEYMVYRVYLVNLVTRVGNSKFFVREFINSAEKMKKEERTSFIRNFNEIFENEMTSTITPNLNTVVNLSIIDFLSSKGIVNALDISNSNKVAQLIYGLRCCIVHNKESEYHITISNFEDYNIIIPLIKKILEVFEELVIKKISDNHTSIDYPQKSVNLY